MKGRATESGGHFEEEVEAEEEEGDVGGPGGEERRELADAAHGFEEAGGGPINDADGDAERNAAESAARADEKSEGNREKHADGSDERKGELDVPLDEEVGDVEASRVEAVNIAAQGSEIHLRGLADFAIEIAGRLGKFGEGSGDEGLVEGDGAAGEIADPAAFEDPNVLRIGPVRAGSEDAALHFESARINFDDAEAAEGSLSGVEDVVIINFGVFAEDPALRLSVGLRRATLDLVAEGVLALVGVGEISFVEENHAGGEDESAEEKRDGEAVKADAAGLAGDDFVVLAHDAERDEDGDESGERGEVVEEEGSEEAEIVDDDEEGNAVAGDVVEQFEESEGFEEEDEDGHEDGEVKEEAAEKIEVH